VSAEGAVAPPWIFIYGTDKVERDLTVLFFGLVFTVAPLPPGNFSADALGCHLLLPVYKPLKGRGNPVKCLAQGYNMRTCQIFFTLYL